MQVKIDVPDIQLSHLLAGLAALLVLFITRRFYSWLSAPGILKYRHNDKTWALVTGASDGIGYELVIRLAEKGFNLIVHGRNSAKVDDILRSLEIRFPERKFRAWILDASDRSSHHLIHNFQEELLREKIQLSVLINNVGISVAAGANFRPLAEVPESHITKLIDVNAVFPTQLTCAVLPLLTSAPSALVLNLGSAAGLFPAVYTGIYGACKAYQFHLTRILRNEMLAENHPHVEVQSVLIGLVQSAGTKEFIARPSVFAPSSATYAKAIVSGVGGGQEMINPHWPHLLQMAIPQALPYSLLAFLMRRAGLDMKATEQKQLREGRRPEPNKLAEALVS